MPEVRDDDANRGDHRSTLNLPKTDFPMRGNLPKREPEWLRFWDSIDLYSQIQKSRVSAPRFVLHDGPPYANGHIHLGHTLNKVLKDIVVKFHAMDGRRAPYVPGWDCHGLPIELQVERSLGDKGSVSKVEFRQRCREYAERFVTIQREEFRRLGVLGDWSRPYLTMDPKFEAAEVRTLGRLFESGGVYRGRKPVTWCPSCRTALAEAEVEYEDHASPSVYVEFPFEDPLPEALRPFSDPRPSVAIWTTTPWTLPANLAIALHPDLEYVLVDLGKRSVLVAEGLLESFLSGIGRKDGRVLARLRGASLEGAKTLHPWIDRTSPIVLADYVTLDAGTGCVHTAPGHGHEDYLTGLRYGLDTYAPVDAEGRFTHEVERFAGRFVFDADSEIIAHLRETGRLLGAASTVHSYPHCWRCKNPVIFRATSQWFVSMEVGGLREKALAEIDRVRWIPKWGRDRIRGMMESRPDWCISRQRAWGVPIVAFYCDGCDAVLATKEIAEHVASRFERGGSDSWFVDPVSELLPAGTTCPSCGGRDFRREEDILDVWFDSGASHVAVLEAREDLGWPADLYLEGSDQHRGWFHTSLLTAVVTHGRAPYEAVLTHGFIVDTQDRKMSKSLGNTITPQAITERYGAEILRLWVAAEDYRGDLQISEEFIGRLVESYRRIRNTTRFLLANLFDFDPAKDARPIADLPEIDRWILDRTERLIDRCHAAYAAYEFHLVYHALNNFCSVDLSSIYLDVAKDRLYCSRADDPARRASQTAIHRVLDRLVRVMAPILSFTAEEAWQHVPSKPVESIFLSDFPKAEAAAGDDVLAEVWIRLLEARGAVTKALEESRKAGAIGHSLDARVSIGFAPGSELGALLESRRDELPALFIVSQVDLDPDLPPEAGSPLLPELRVRVEAPRGKKCARCWNVRESVGSNGRHPEICARCADVLGD